VPATSLEILPVVHARGGRLVGPDAEPLEEELKTVARQFSRDWDAIYLVDLDGLRDNRPQVGLLQQLSDRVHTWADGGARTPEDVMDMLMAGAEQATVRYHTAEERETVRESVRLSEHVALGMEFRDQELLQNRAWPATPPELVELADDLRIPLVVVDHSRAGTAAGIDRSVAWHARHHEHGAYYAGGIASQRDLDVLEDLGYDGALISTALLEGEDFQGEEWKGPPGTQDADDEDDGGFDPRPDPMEGIL
jgi:uncharacterized protein related to proFAR isomerase